MMAPQITVEATTPHPFHPGTALSVVVHIDGTVAGRCAVDHLGGVSVEDWMWPLIEADRRFLQKLQAKIGEVR
jgi:hypothetical protein